MINTKVQQAMLDLPLWMMTSYGQTALRSKGQKVLKSYGLLGDI